ncbi:MAG: hypothetical protein L0H64_21045 [Pseudonocardia sp.]|nr:hypothetical protein [Pseudonocardia sp.]
MTTSGHPLRILYRSHGGDNSKPRPEYYSKLLALAALLRAVADVEATVEVTFLTDGPMPAETLQVMERFGRVVALRRGGSAARSYREMLDFDQANPGPADELVWLAEDDYLYRPDALCHLLAGAAAQPGVDYFTLYGSRALDPERSRVRPAVRPDPAAQGSGVTFPVGDIHWYRAVSTTSTFGVRRRALTEDIRLLRHFPLTGGAWDSATFYGVQGYAPHSGRQLRRDLLPIGELPVARWPRSAVRGLVRIASMPLAWRRPDRRRLLMGSDPELITHMEGLGPFSHTPSRRTTAIDWAAVARETAEWGRDHGIPVVIPTPAARPSDS